STTTIERSSGMGAGAGTRSSWEFDPKESRGG
ncbi:MAG: hypothetical protein ACI8WY_003664, partial [Planctomycetota bacterium]